MRSHPSFLLPRASWVIVLAMVLTACSTTSNLPEEETLYAGISEIAYGRKAEAKKSSRTGLPDSTGVITSLAHAYTAMEELLSGSASAGDLFAQLSRQADHPLTREERDSLRREVAVYEEATAVAKTEVEAALAYAPNGSIFGSSSARWPFRIGLGVYNRYAGSHTRFGKWMVNMLGSTPVYISTVSPQLRAQVAQQTLRNYGFLRGRVEHEVQPDAKHPREAYVGYSVYPGQLFRLGQVEYQHFSTLADSLIRATEAARLIHAGDAFSAAQLDAERKRLSTLLRNNGFYYWKPEYVAFRADTIQQPGRVQLQVRPRTDIPAQAKNRFYMGRTTITVLPYDDYVVTDSAAMGRDFQMRWSGGTRKPPIRLGPIRHYLFYRRGSLYRSGLHDVIQEKLSGMGVFSTVQMNYVPRDTSATCDTLDVNIFAVLDKPYDAELEVKVTNKSNGLLGPGLSFGLTKRNAFRGAESLSFKVYGSYEWQTGVNTSETRRSLLNSYELGASATLSYPRIRVLGIQNLLPRQAMMATDFKVNANWMNRAGYFQMLQFGTSVAYTYQRRRAWKHELVPFRLDYNLLMHRTQRFDEVVAKNQALYVSMRDQMVPGMSYTLTYAPRPKGGRSRTLILSGREGGNVLSAAYALAGQPFNRRDKKLFNVPFAQYWRLTAEWRETVPVGEGSSIVTRAFAGAVWSYGNSTTAPYSELFTVGGANSIRAFGVRTIGPGSYHPASSGWSYVDQVGDLKMEVNAEWRFPMVGSLEGALFVDAGNVWLLRREAERSGGFIGDGNFLRSIAVGTGLGFRYDLEFLVMRFDIGVGLHAPYDTGRSGFYNIRRFGDSLGFHLAVGYPF